MGVQSCPTVVPGEQLHLLLHLLQAGPGVPGGPSNLAQLWLPLPFKGSSLHSSVQALQCQKPRPGTDTLLSLSQGPPPHGCSQQSPCLTPPSRSPGSSMTTPTGPSPSTLWSCSRWVAPASPRGSTPTAAPDHQDHGEPQRHHQLPVLRPCQLPCPRGMEPALECQNPGGRGEGCPSRQGSWLCRSLVGLSIWASKD